MKKTIVGLLIIAAANAAFLGCISHDETVVRDVERNKVEFENDTAARIFYEVLSQRPGPHSRAESTTRVEIPIVFEHKQRVVAGPNAAFNDAVADCDTNRDGRITELEAKIFAGHRAK